MSTKGDMKLVPSKKDRLLEPAKEATAVDMEPMPSEEDRLLKPVPELPQPSKHRIFLSHSGAQKNFVEQLCLDLEQQLHHTPFFDRHLDSLPKGEDFAQYIFQAAQQCELAIVVVSEEYFSQSKWPMLELSMLVQSSKCMIVPLFFGLSYKEFKEAERRERWFQMWDEWAQIDPRVSVEHWKHALCELQCRSGLEFVAICGEVGFRKDVLAAVSTIFPPKGELPKHYLPDFNFRMVNGFPHPTTDQFIEVASYFPGCTSVAYTPPFLVVLWADLPRKPWPLTFGEIPLFYGTLEDRRPPTCGRTGGSQPILTSATDYLEPWVHPQGKIKEVFELLVARGIGIHYFGWSGVRWYVEVLSATDGTKLPSKICGLLVLWKIWENEDSECARRFIVPDGGIVIDIISYTPTLRPGVLVESKEGRRSTSGIPLLAPNGDRYITVANHGFPEEDLNVYHPIYGEDTLIAKVEFSFPNSDIALAKLEGGNTYSTISFDGDELNGIKLDGLIHSNDVPLLTTLFLDSPFNGKCEGIVTSIGIYVLPIGSTNGSFRYVECNMIYFGNGANDIISGSCGSPMWTAEKMVAAFFRWYYSKDAIAFAPVVDILIDSGYDIDPIL